MASVTRTETRPGPPPSSSPTPTTTPAHSLQSGDRLSAQEFDRRYAAMPDVRAELVEGVVYVSSPVSQPHGASHGILATWIGTYQAFTPGVDASCDGTIQLDPDNRHQPDVHLKVLPGHGGRTRLTDDAMYVVGAPELAVEIALSTASYDLHDKKRAYRRNEVWEYLVWRVEDREIDWFILREGRYETLQASAEGILKSERFPGLWLDPAAAVHGDLATVLRVVQAGIASPEHAAFVESLAAQATKAR